MVRLIPPKYGIDLRLGNRRLTIQFVGTESINECLKLLQNEQQLLCSVVAGNTISSCRLQQRVVIAYRYFLALTRHTNYQNADHYKDWCNDAYNGENNEYVWTSFRSSVSRKTRNRFSCFVRSTLENIFDKELSDNQIATYSEQQKNIFGLARIGTRTALNFAFAFLRRAWRSGNWMKFSELREIGLDD